MALAPLSIEVFLCIVLVVLFSSLILLGYVNAREYRIVLKAVEAFGIGIILCVNIAPIDL